MLIGVIRLGRNRTVEKSLVKFARRRRSENERGGIGNRREIWKAQPTTSAVTANLRAGAPGVISSPRHLFLNLAGAR
jgi:hypothetical protein